MVLKIVQLTLCIDFVEKEMEGINPESGVL